MKAIVLPKYGSPDVLELREIPKPLPKEGEVLVKIMATSVNDYEWSLVRGRPRAYRLMFGLFKPKMRPGMELAGIVEAVGPNADKFQPGDAVYGDTADHSLGTFAQYMSVSEKALSLKPESMSFEEATSIPHASMLAYQALIDLGQIRDGMKVLINGAGGGFGTFGVQIAKQYDVELTGVDSALKLEMMKEMGFDHVLDYQQTDFTKTGEKYDLIVDPRSTRGPWAFARALKPGGRFVSVGGDLPKLLRILLAKGWIRRFAGKHLHILSLKANKDLDKINTLYEEGKIKVVIDGPFSLEEAPKAVQRFGSAKHLGKVVIRVDH